MAPIVQKIAEQYSTDIDFLGQALEQASRAHLKAFELDRFIEDESEVVEDFSCDASVPSEQPDGEVFTQISAHLFDLMQDLKSCNMSTITEEYDDISNEDVMEDLKLALYEDMNGLPELLNSQDESDFLEQALGFAAQQYAMSFASDRMVYDQVDSDDSELFYDCIDFDLPENLVEMYMPMASGACQMSDKLFDMVQDMKDMKMTENEDLDELPLESPDFISELELSMLEDMNNLPVQEPEKEIAAKAMNRRESTFEAARALVPHPKQLASSRTKTTSSVTCSLPIACFANARSSPCGGMSCGTPKVSCGSTPKVGERTPKRVAASPASAAWRAQRV